MTQEEKARAYDEALERARRIKNGEDNWHYSDLTEIIPALEEVLPELTESEDERIIRFLKHAATLDAADELFQEYGVKHTQVIAYLEKQKDINCLACDQHLKGYLAGRKVTEEEKQKEQKVDIDKLRRDLYQSGYNDGYQHGKEDTQKEQKPVVTHGETYHVDTLGTQQVIAGKMPQKPAEWTLPKDFEEAVYKVANFISPFDSQEELRKVSHRFAEQLLSLAKKELDKPAECSKATINGEPIPTENYSVDIPLAERSPMKFKEGDKVVIHCTPERAKSIFKIYDGQEGTIDAIWDLSINPWGNIKVILPNGCNNTFYDSELELINKNESKQEWNEEDERMLSRCVKSIEISKQFADSDTFKVAKDKEIDWLRVLAEKMGFHKCKIGEVVTEWKKEDIDDKMLFKPKQEWSEEDEDNLCRVIRVLEDNDSDWKELSGWLKSLRPSWKPSEKQMTALWSLKEIKQVKESGWKVHIESLYEDLKKLENKQ